jgi:4-carboxymuconolactone decarboxylase
MSRLPEPDPARLTAAQRAMFERRGGRVAGPGGVLMWVPEIGEPADALILALRNGKLDRRLYRVMCLVIARTWSADYVFNLHKKGALEEGVPAEVVEAIRTRRVPTFLRDDERIVYELVTELLTTHALLPATYERAVGALGLEHTIELVAGIGIYSTIGMLLRAFDVTVPEGERQLL